MVFADIWAWKGPRGNFEQAGQIGNKFEHTLRYSLTLHDGNGERLVGFDNAHPVTSGSGPGAKQATAFDHKHRLQTIRPYEYADAASLLADFWTEVEAVLAQRGVKL